MRHYLTSIAVCAGFVLVGIAGGFHVEAQAQAPAADPVAPADKRPVVQVIPVISFRGGICGSGLPLSANDP